ncbi:MAG: long-chain acyl-CoA synthetase [Methylobacteriaceae bacterium]|jgi:long-chain acyl-CoA synthetase|nr:long-chain acyl-CoA synthetase [Methylobacteriaceae bacterium]
MAADPATNPQTLPQWLRHHAHVRPKAVALRQKRFGIWQPTNWAQYWRRARAIGMGLRALGVKTGAHIGIISENRIEWVLAQLGTGAIGAVTVGVYATSPAPEVAYVLGHGDCEIAFCEDQEQADKVLETWRELPKLTRIIVMETKGFRAYDASRVMSFDALEELGAKADAEELDCVDALVDGQRPDDIGIIIYTSGSTGKPKGAMISYANIAAAVPGYAERLKLDATSTTLSYLPLCHVAEQALTTFAPLQYGMMVNFGESLRTVQEDLREVAPSLFLGVPRIWEKMHSAIHIKTLDGGRLNRMLVERAFRACEPFALTGPRTLREKLTFLSWYALVFRPLQNFAGLRRTRMCVTGAAPIPPKVFMFFRTMGLPLIEVYGQTESSGGVTGQLANDVKLGTVGPAVEGAEVRIAEDGEVLVRGGMVFAGYYKDPELTSRTIVDGWLHTGDIAEWHDGHLTIVDRKKDVIITSGGKNLSPSLIENAMKASPFIKECIVIGDARRYVTALIQIDFDNVGKWAEQKGLAFTTFRSLADHPAVFRLISQEVENANDDLAPVEQVKRFRLLTKELDHDDGEVTATMKVRRASIYAKFAAEIEGLYGPQSTAA